MKNTYKQIDINTFLCMESNITYKVGDVIELKSDIFDNHYRYGKLFVIKSFMITDNPDFSIPNPYKPKRHNNGRVFNFVTATIEAEFEHTIAFEQFTHYIDPEGIPMYQQISTTAFYCLDNKQTYKVGDEVTIAPGLWIDNNVYGRTFKIQKFEVVDPIMIKAEHPFTPIREFNGKIFKRVYMIFEDDRIKPGLSWRGMPNEEYKSTHGSIESKRGSMHLSSVMLDGEYPYKFYSNSNFVEGTPGGSKELIEEWNKIRLDKMLSASIKYIQITPMAFCQIVYDNVFLYKVKDVIELSPECMLRNKLTANTFMIISFSPNKKGRLEESIKYNGQTFDEVYIKVKTIEQNYFMINMNDIIQRPTTRLQVEQQVTMSNMQNAQDKTIVQKIPTLKPKDVDKYQQLKLHAVGLNQHIKMLTKMLKDSMEDATQALLIIRRNYPIQQSKQGQDNGDRKVRKR